MLDSCRMDGTLPAEWVKAEMPGSAQESGQMQVMLGEIRASMLNLDRSFTEYRIDAKEDREKMWIELRSIKHDANAREQIVSGHLEMQDRRRGEIERRVGALTDEVHKLNGLISAVQQPVNQLIMLKQRLWLIVGGITAIVSFLWILLAPVYATVMAPLVEHFLGLKPPPYP
jgi:hypothetical protein